MSNPPSSWARTQLPHALAAFKGDRGRLIKLVRSTGLMATWPVETFCALEPTTGWTANTSNNASWFAQTNSFHECGFNAIPCGRAHDANNVRLPAPNPNPAGTMNVWGRMHDDVAVVKALGRKATMVAEAWKLPEHYIDQVAVALAMHRDGYKQIVRSIPEVLRPKQEGSHWAIALLYVAFSTGPGGGAGVLGKYPSIAGTDESHRWRAFCRAFVADYKDQAPDGKAGRHPQAGHVVLRAFQKLALLELMVESTKTGTGTDADGGAFNAGIWTDREDLERCVVLADKGQPCGPLKLGT